MNGTEGGVAHKEGRDPSPVPTAKLSKTHRDEWSEEGIMHLLDVYESKWLIRNRAKLKGSDWEEIAHQVSMRTLGSKSLNQCKNKIESMKKRYRAESATRQGPSSTSSWHFYARMDAMLKGSANCSPQPKSNHLIHLPKADAEFEQARELHESVRDDGSNSSPIDVNANVNAVVIANDMLKGSTNYSPQPKSNHLIHLTKADAEVEQARQLHESVRDDGSNSSPIDVNANVDAVVIAYETDNNNNNNNNKEKRRKDSDESTSKEDGTGKASKPSKRRNFQGSEIAESIRLLAESMLKIEEARIVSYKELERIRTEAEIKRSAMELQRTEIIAKTQLEIAKLFARQTSSGSNKCVSSSLRIDKKGD